MEPFKMEVSSKQMNGSSGPSTENPMQNPLILQRVFEFCPVETLRNCRLVSKDWCLLSLDAWRKKAILTVHFKGKEGFGSGISQGNGILMDCFTKLLQTKDGEYHHRQLWKKPYLSYRLSFDWIWLQMKEKDEECDKFIHALGESWKCVRYLELNKCDFYLGNQLPDLIFRRAANLRTLKLINPGFKDGIQTSFKLDEDDNEFLRQVEEAMAQYGPPHANLKILELNFSEVLPSISLAQCVFPFWRSLLKNMPKLEELKVVFFNFRCLRTVFNKIMLAIKELRQEDNSILRLKRLDIMDLNSDNHAMELITPEIPKRLEESSLLLEELSIDLGCDTSPHMIQSVLETQAETLKILRVFRGPVKTLKKREKLQDGKFSVFQPDFLLPMKALEEIELLNGLCWGFHLMRCLKAPNLKKIIFQQPYPDKCGPNQNFQRLNVALEREFRLGGQLRWTLKGYCVSSLELFEFHHKVVSFSQKDILSLGKAFPNLKYLAIAVGSQTFPRVCEAWPNLKSLSLLRHRPRKNDFVLHDEAFTGTRVKVMMRNNVGRPKNPKLPRVYSIRDLKHLTDLKIDLSISLHLTDHSIYNGLLRVPKLISLKARVRKITPEGKAALEKRGIYWTF